MHVLANARGQRYCKEHDIGPELYEDHEEVRESVKDKRRRATMGAPLLVGSDGPARPLPPPLPEKPIAASEAETWATAD